MAANNGNALAGVTVLVTRPLSQAAALAARIERHGGEAVVFPVINILPPADDGELNAAINNLTDADLLIFVSVHAVTKVAERLTAGDLRMPNHIRIAAVGKKTAAACDAAGFAADFVPREHINSEGLLAAMQGFDVAGNTVLIFRGQCGRELLRGELKSRGATVRHVQTYRREVTTESIAPVLQRWRANEIDMVTISSAAVLDALVQLLGDHRDLLANTPVLAYSNRVAEQCRRAGARCITVAVRPDDEAVVDAIINRAKR